MGLLVMDEIAMGALRFDAFTLELSDEPQLKRKGEPITLRPQCLKVLAYLARHPGKVISNADLIESCWENPKQTNVNSVAQCIREIREALGQTNHAVIRTVPRRGYLFAASVVAVPDMQSDDAHSNSVIGKPFAYAQPATGVARRISEVSQRWLAFAAGAMAVIGVVGWLVWAWSGRSAEPTMMAMPSIVMTPVKASGADTDKLVAGLVDEIGAGIWRAPRGFKPDIRHADILELARGRQSRADEARYIVKTSAALDGSTIHLNVQLVDAGLARQVWVGTFDYSSIESGARPRTAARVGRSLVAEILRAEVQRPLPAKPGASHWTMLGRWLMNNERSAQTNAQAIDLFEKAIRAEPDYVVGLVNYTRAMTDHILNGWAPKAERMERITKAEAAINRAIKLEPDNAGAYLSRGGLLRARGDFAQAIVAFEKALEHDPYFANAHAELGRTKIDVGLAQQTEGHIKAAIALSPTDFALYIWCYWAGLGTLHMGDHGAALAWLQRSLEANRAYDNTLRLMAIAYAYAGDESEGQRRMQEFLKLRPGFTLARWKQENTTRIQIVGEQRAQMVGAMQRLGVPEAERREAAGR
ncbi:MAG: winged helix-turn-helix domain-containing protein [Hyphomicrobium sp.]|nr:winged helix-turn-helix domain-containing protein [Hyphomicrobium sp.]